MYILIRTKHIVNSKVGTHLLVSVKACTALLCYKGVQWVCIQANRHNQVFKLDNTNLNSTTIWNRSITKNFSLVEAPMKYMIVYNTPNMSNREKLEKTKLSAHEAAGESSQFSSQEQCIISLTCQCGKHKNCSSFSTLKGAILTKPQTKFCTVILTNTNCEPKTNLEFSFPKLWQKFAQHHRNGEHTHKVTLQTRVHIHEVGLEKP